MSISISMALRILSRCEEKRCTLGLIALNKSSTNRVHTHCWNLKKSFWLQPQTQTQTQTHQSLTVRRGNEKFDISKQRKKRFQTKNKDNDCLWTELNILVWKQYKSNRHVRLSSEPKLCIYHSPAVHETVVGKCARTDCMCIHQHELSRPTSKLGEFIENSHRCRSRLTLQ